MKLFIKYSIVGTSGAIVDLTALYLLVELAGINVYVAAVFSFILAVINNFLLNKFWTFNDKNPNYSKQFIKFLSVSIFGLMLTLSFMYLFIDVVGIWYMLAKAITTLIVLFWNYTLNRFWTFKIARQQEIW